MVINFSIIIPHRNTPLLLERLIDSIPKREDIEIIVVDDHSDPDVVDLDHFPCKEMRNMIIVSNTDSPGAGHARNFALPLAKGKWILFADSDDFYNAGFNAFLDKYVNSEVDVIYFNANSVDTDTYEPSNRADHLQRFICNYLKDPKRGEIVMRYMFTEPWGKLIKRKLIEDYSIRFDDTSIHEDVRFACLVGHYASKVLVDRRQLYCVTSRTDSLSRTMNPQKYLDELFVFARWKKFLMNNQPSLILLKFDNRAYHFTRHLWKNNKLFREEYRILRKAKLSTVFILGLILKYILKSVSYKIGL
jgi:glycosyltransferase involved in cell wall biosynthesis